MVTQRTFRCFNPCFHGSLSRTGTGAKDKAVCYEFQSLFSWISLSNRGARCHGCASRCVSILVFMDLSLEHGADREQITATFRFQSLFSWISLSNGPAPICCARFWMVSILVFMDLSLEPVGQGGFTFSTFGFNPCFHGSLSRTCWVLIFAMPVLGCFNPCFHGSLSRTSLVATGTKVRTHCFNPCFHGSLSRTTTLKAGHDHSGKFQSLFSWISLSNTAASVPSS